MISGTYLTVDLPMYFQMANNGCRCCVAIRDKRNHVGLSHSVQRRERIASALRADDDPRIAREDQRVSDYVADQIQEEGSDSAPIPLKI